jgi:ATP-binding cassette subfamily C protein
MIDVVRAHPGRSLITLFALLLAGIVQGLSLSALLPMLQVVLDPQKSGTELSDSPVVAFLRDLGITPALANLLIIIVIGMTLKSVLILFANRHVGYTVAQVATDLRLKLLRALLGARWDYFLHQPIGVLTNAMATQSVRASAAYLNGTRTIALLIEVVVYSIVAFTVSWQVTLSALAGGALMFLVFGRLVRTSRRAGKHQTTIFASLLARMTDTLQSVKALKSMGLAERASAVQESETGRLNDALRRQVFSEEALRALQETVIVMLVALGLYAVVTHWAIPVASIMVLVVLLVRVLTATSKVQRSYQKMVAQESAYWALMRLVDNAEQARETGGSQSPHFTREIRLDQVGFAIGDKQILHDTSLSIPVGSFTTLVGPSGSGKTTVVDLITGLLKPTAGRVLVDDTPLADCSLEQWRHMIGYVPQEILLLHDSVLNNVTLGDPALTEADTERALRAAGAWDFVAAMPEGLHTVVGERGGKVSGGQRQRLCIARALVRRPKLLILDEATSALDPASEAALCATLGELRGSITVLAVSHQSGLADIADRRIHIEQGALTGEVERAAGQP